MASIGTMGKVQTISPASKAGSPSSPGFLRCNNDMGKLLLDGVEYGDATAFGIKLDNGLDGDTYTIGQSSPRVLEAIARLNPDLTPGTGEGRTYPPRNGYCERDFIVTLNIPNTINLKRNPWR